MRCSKSLTTKIAGWALVPGLMAGSVGCETKAQTGALAGGAGGAAVGATIGSFSHHRAGEGALIGGAVGAIGGYIVGNEMDKKDQKEKEHQAQAYDRSARDARYDSPPPAPAGASARVTKQDVIHWTESGVKEDVILDRIERSGTVFRITAADENDLRDAGVSEEVVRAMKDTVVRR
jgi:hypothetical protein